MPIITYDPIDKKFCGIDLDEMIKKSERLRYAATLNGISDIKKDMEQKIKCLEEFDKKDHTHQDIMNHIYESYETKRLHIRKKKVP